MKRGKIESKPFSEQNLIEFETFNAAQLTTVYEWELEPTLYKPGQVHRMEDFRARVRWRDAGFWNHFGHGEPDEARGQEDKDEKRAGQETKRTVCKDDEFVSRGANPRTGIVSPFIFGEWSGNDWQGLGIPAEKTERGVTNGRGWGWGGDGFSCGRVENVPLIPTTQGFDGGPSCAKSSKRLQHIKISSRVNSKPTQMRDEKIQEYQNNLADVCRSKTQNAARMQTSILSVPTQWKPAGLTTQPTDLQHVRRKKVASGHVKNGGLTNAETSKNVRQYLSEGVAMNDISAFRTSTVRSTEAGTPFTTPADHLNDDLENPATSRDTVVASAASKTDSAASGNYIARLHFLQPTHVASLTTSYRRPTQILAIQPRGVDIRDNRRNIGSASTIDTTCQPWNSEQRPQVYRKFGTTSIPTVDFHESELEDERQCFLSLAPQGNASITNQSMRVSRVEPSLQNHNIYQGCAIPNLGRKKANVQPERPVSKAELIYLVIELNSAFSAHVANA